MATQSTILLPRIEKESYREMRRSIVSTSTDNQSQTSHLTNSDARSSRATVVMRSTIWDCMLSPANLLISFNHTVDLVSGEQGAPKGSY